MGICAELIELFEDSEIEYKVNERVTSTFRIGGTAALSLYPDSTEKLITCLDLLDEYGVKFHVLGNCSNVLFGFEHFDGALVFTQKTDGMIFEDTHICAMAGVHLSRLAAEALARGLEGLEFAHGIPGRVGGAVYMNAGAYGGAMSDVVEYTTAYDTKSKRIVVFMRKEHGFGYRDSIYIRNPQLVCLEACFSLRSGNRDEIEAKMKENMNSRRAKQPVEYPSAGSYFKRPEGHFAGKLIEDAGLKGFSVGGAQVSQKHAGFIINTGNASTEDVLMLEKIIKERVMSLYGVLLEREVRLIK